MVMFLFRRKRAQPKDEWEVSPLDGDEERGIVEEHEFDLDKALQTAIRSWEEMRTEMLLNLWEERFFRW